MVGLAPTNRAAAAQFGLWLVRFYTGRQYTEGTMTDDTELLRRYSEHRSEAAFAALVRKHVDLVYSSALRQMQGDHHRADEITQMVFTSMARKASALARHPVLAAWLHRSCRLAALDLRRREGRRHAHEMAAATEAQVTSGNGEDLDWREVGPVLDEAINELGEGDRQAILMRFFRGNAFADIGAQLRLTENAARMRVERALGKLRERLLRRGISSSAAALGAALAAQSVTAAPAGAASAAVAAATAVGSASAWISLMTSTKLPLSLAAAVLVGGSSLVGYQEIAREQAATRLENLDREDQALSKLRKENQRLIGAALRSRLLQGEAADIGPLRQQLAELEARMVTSSTTMPAANAEAARKVTLKDANVAFDLSKLDRRPKILKQGRPQNPAMVNYSGASAEVLIDFLVGPDGLVYNASVLTSSDRAFEESALQTVKLWEFTPGQVAGQNVTVHMQVPIVYTASPDTPAPSASTWF
jgi:RNA polymerase sigma factor (sigma-70 family)